MAKKTLVTIGSKYFKLTVLAQVGKDKHGNILFQCRCDCGNEAIVKSTSLTMKSRPTRSCGCYIVEAHQLAPGLAASKSLYRRYLKRDLDQKRLSNLTFEDFLSLTKSNCHYCDSKPSQTLSFKTANGAYVYNGLDRLDNALGYTKENSVACCKTCNFMKKDLSKKDFLNHIVKVVQKSF